MYYRYQKGIVEMKRYKWLLFCGVLSAMLLVACGTSGTVEPGPAVTGTEEATLTSTEKPDPTATPTPIPSPTATPAPPLSDILLQKYVLEDINETDSTIQKSSMLVDTWKGEFVAAFASPAQLEKKTVVGADARAYKMKHADQADGLAGVSVTAIDKGTRAGAITSGDYVLYSNVDFGDVGAEVFRFAVDSKMNAAGVIAVVLDELNNDPIAYLQIPKDGATPGIELATRAMEKVSGTHDVYLLFLGEDFAIDYWYANCESLAELYSEYFPIGVALPQHVLLNPVYYDTINANFNSITCENEMKADALLDQAKSRAGLPGTYLCPEVKFDNCLPAIQFALEHGQKIRFHTLVWQNQTTEWLFTEDYTVEGPLVSREVMLQRMENFIRQVLSYFDENYPGLIYAVDVVNEAYNGPGVTVQTTNNRWYDTIGEDYIYYAFKYARKYAADYMKLFYNDYNCLQKTNKLPINLQQMKDEGLIDGIGMQSHFSVTQAKDSVANNATEILMAVKKFCDAGYELQLTELDIGMKNKDPWHWKKQVILYKELFEGLVELKEEGYSITGVTVWGLSDTLTWRGGQYPLLFNTDLTPKDAYYAVLEGVK